MEYRVYKKIRNYLKIHIYLRIFIGMIIWIIAIVPLILPFPWSFPFWVALLVLSLLIILPGNKIRHIIKLRKWLIFLMTNFHRKAIVRHKMRDFSSHIKQILNDKHDRRMQRLERLKMLQSRKK